jgi:hypothetical protein
MIATAAAYARYATVIIQGRMRLSFLPAGPLPGRLLSVYGDYAIARELRKKEEGRCGPSTFSVRVLTSAGALPLPPRPADTCREDEGAEEGELEAERS